MPAALIIDGHWLTKAWEHVGNRNGDKLDVAKLRRAITTDYLSSARGEAMDEIVDAAYFNSEAISDEQQRFYRALEYPPPKGAGLRVELFPVENKPLEWPASMGGGGLVRHPVSGAVLESRKQRGVDTALTTRLLISHEDHGWDKLFLVAGDKDFEPPVERLVERKRVRLFLVGVPDMISLYLRRCLRSDMDLFDIDAEADRLRLRR